MKLIAKLLVMVLVVILSGCKEQILYSKLNEQEANEMVALLYASGLPATKVAKKGGVFRVDTSTEAFADSMAVLQSHGLPRKRFANMGDVFAKEGFVSSPLEERARLNYALSEELAHSLSAIDGVVFARVHLAVPEKEYLSDEPKSASASVFVKHRYNVDLTDSVSKMKSLVIDGVENMPYENVTVGLFAAEPPALVSAFNTPVLQAGVQLERGVLASGAATLIAFGMVSLLVGRATRKRKLARSSALHVTDSHD